MGKKNNNTVVSWLKKGFFLLLVTFFSSAQAAIYTLSSENDVVFGEPQMASPHRGDTISTLARRYDMGFYELLDANPGLDPKKLRGRQLVIPSRFILPNGTPREGIVINLAELRLYYFIPNTQQVFTAPVGIGRLTWDTPLGVLSIIEKKENPVWHPTPLVRADVLRKRGLVLPLSVPAGPENPLGNYMLRLSEPTYLIHGTNDPIGVGRRVTAGCMRLYPEDIKTLFELVEVGTQVTIVNQPYKVGVLNHLLYFEAHQPLLEMRMEGREAMKQRWQEVIQNAGEASNETMNWDRVRQVAIRHEGIPYAVAKSES